jgi:CubicO group peptidase (beta-lactamase class C family)
MFRSFSVVLAAACLCLAATAHAAEDLAPILAKAMDGSKVPAMGVLVIRDRKVDGEAVRGVRRNDGIDPVRLEDPWHLGSDGKAMTATMAARLVDRGVLSWSTPLDKMLPELAASMNPQYRKVTLIQLLSHHTGLPHDIGDDSALAAFVAQHGRETLTQQRMAYISQALQQPPVGPTTAMNYSNTGLIIAAVLAERATGQSFEELMRREVFKPLGMDHVGFGLTRAGQPFGHLSGRPATPADGNPDFFAPAGNMYMPLEDWARFCIDQLDGAAGHGKLLKPETYRLMQTAQPGGPYGLGWGAIATAAGLQGPMLSHAGSDGTWYANVVLLPTRGSGVLVTANAGEKMGGDKAVNGALVTVLRELTPPASQPATPQPPVSQPGAPQPATH